MVNDALITLMDSVASSPFTIIMNQYHLKPDSLSILFFAIKCHIVKYTDQAFEYKEGCSLRLQWRIQKG